MVDFPLPAGSIVKVVITFEFANIFCEHRLHFSTRRGVTFLGEVCTNIAFEMCQLYLLPVMCSAVRLISVTASSVGAGIILNQTYFPHEPTYGVLPEQAVSPIVANVHQFRTDTAGRQGRGRMLRFGFPLAYVENYVHLTDYAYGQMRLDADLMLSKYRADGDSDLLTLGVFSYKQFHGSGDATLSFSPIKFINVSKRLTSCGHRRS